jgi:hypothetical protein
MPQSPCLFRAQLIAVAFLASAAASMVAIKRRGIVSGGCVGARKEAAAVGAKTRRARARDGRTGKDEIEHRGVKIKEV